MLLYAVHPLINAAINALSPKQHLAYSCVFFILYFCIGSIKNGAFFESKLILFVGIYFIIAYMKKYNSDILSNKKLNYLCLLIGIILLFFLQIIMNFMGLRFESIGSRPFYFATNHNPIIFIIAFSIFNIFRAVKIQSNAINYIASLTIFIYIIHENMLFKKYLKLNLMFNFWEASGRINIVFFILICALILFGVSLFLAVVYNKLLQFVIEKIADKILRLCMILYGKFECFLLKIK